jgi:hypothetical protein
MTCRPQTRFLTSTRSTVECRGDRASVDGEDVTWWLNDLDYGRRPMSEFAAK